MAQFVEFIGNHLVLAGMWVVTMAAIIFYHQRTGSKSVGPQGAVALINRRDAVVVDVRDKKEFEAGHIVDAVNIPLAKLKAGLNQIKKYKERPLVVVCKLGQQSPQAVKTLEEEGYNEVYRLNGGISEWKAQSLPLVQK